MIPKSLASVIVAVAISAVISRAGAQPADPLPPGDIVPQSAGPPLSPSPAVTPVEAAVAPAPLSLGAGSAKESPDLGAPMGRAAPPTESATRGEGKIRPGLEIFAQYSYRNTRAQDGGRDWFHVFDVPRVHGAVEGEWNEVRGRLVLEATRSASEGALVGVSGDSLVLRVREAFGGYRPVRALELSAGVVPTLTVAEIDGTGMMRPIAPSAVETAGLASPADVGARARLELPERYGFIALAAYNGEGYTSRELNRGKNLEAAGEVHPLPSGPLLPFGLFGSYVAGSSGTGLSRTDRFTGGLVWQGARVRGGAFFTHAWGVAQVGVQKAIAASAFLRIEPVNRVLLGARLDHLIRDTSGDPTDAVTSLFLSGGYRIADPLEAFIVLTRTIPSTRAQDEQPGSNAWELRFVTRVIF